MFCTLNDKSLSSARYLSQCSSLMLIMIEMFPSESVCKCTDSLVAQHSHSALQLSGTRQESVTP